MGVHAETHILTEMFNISLANCWQYLILAVLVSLLGIAMCWVFHQTEHFAAHHLPNPFVRILVGGAIVTAMTLLVGDHRFNGAGMDMALKAVAGEADWYSFLLKMLFTAVTLSAGFKGGEIVPTFCIGATFGCVLGGLLGLDPGMAAALGLVGLFCCATNSPLASIVLSIEMFGSTNLYLFAFVCVICFVLSGNSGLYASQIIQFSKSDLKNQRFYLNKMPALQAGIFSVLGGGAVHGFPEGPGKITHILKSAGCGNVRYFFLGFSQQFGCLPEPVLLQILNGSGTYGRAETAQAFTFADGCTGSDIGGGNFCVKMAVDPAEHGLDA